MFGSDYDICFLVIYACKYVCVREREIESVYACCEYYFKL